MQKIKMYSDTLALLEKTEAKYWEEAYPIGNGTLGAMVYGGAEREKLALNHDTLWSGYPRTDDFRGNYSSLVRAKELMREGKYVDAENELRNGFSSYGSAAYMAMGDMDIEFTSPIGKVSRYRRILELDRAVNTVTYSIGKTKIRRESFVSYPDKAVVYAVFADGGKVNFNINMSSVLYSVSYCEDGKLYLMGECPINSEQNMGRTDRRQLYLDDRKGMRFFSASKVVTDGEIKCKDRTMSVAGATYAFIYICAETSFNGFDKDPVSEGKDCRTPCLKALEKVSAKEYSSVKNRHVRDHKKYFDRFSVSVGNSGKIGITTKERMERAQNGEKDIALPILLLNYGRYLTIAASRSGSQAMNLQGIWSSYFSPPWHSNYTVNINTEMNYFPTLGANLAEMYEPLTNLVCELVEPGKVTAKTLYNAPGWVCHHNTDIWRHTQPVAGHPIYFFWCAGSGWLCHSLYEYYEYTQDAGYLKKIYPIMSGAAEFYLSQLDELPDGTRGIFPSTSPENNYICDDGISRCSVSETTEMTMAIVRELFGNIIKSAEKLGISDTVSEAVKKELPRLRTPQIGSDGRLLEWYGEHPDAEVHHRHVSHLYGLHPGHEITPEKTPELAKACAKTLEVRGDDGTGWSIAWKINFFARLGDGEHAMSLVRRQLWLSNSYGINYGKMGGTYPNMLCAHPPFQIDGNFGALSGMLEMMVQSDINELCICPACPSEWDNLAVSGICAKGGRVVDMVLKNGALSECIIHGTKPEKIFFKGKDVTKNFQKTDRGYEFK